MIEFLVTGGNEGANITIENQVERGGVFFADVKILLAREAIPEAVKLSFQFPVIDCYSVWSSKLRQARQLGPNWLKRMTESRLASGMPLHAIVSAAGRNRMTIALSDAMTPTSIATGVCEEDACLDCEITFFQVQIAPLKEYRATIRIDFRDVEYSESIYDVVAWWERDCGYTPAHVPEHARLPMNSLWYSVPFVGIHSKNYVRFGDMLLSETGNNKTFWALDPRYYEVRKFLICTYVRAVLEWKLDGLKLDFIDSFVLRGKSLEYDPRRDCQSLEEAIDLLMSDITRELAAINPEILIEFRQSYVGPAIRKYGNMLRVADCPADPIMNRQDTVNLRLTSGKTAVHSDMLMWNYEEPVECAALQLASVLYSVPQISVKIAKLNPEHRKMLQYYLRFWREHRDILIDGKLHAENPECMYSLVRAKKDGRAIVTAYADRVIECASYDEIIAVNASGHKTLILKGAKGKGYVVVDCMGESLAQGSLEENLCEVAVPMSGMIFIKEREL